MRGGLLRSWPVLGVFVVLGACSNIIGISSYEVDPTLDDTGDAGGAQGGTETNGGVSSSGSKNGGGAGAPAAGEGPGTGGDSTGGTANAAGGEAGAGGDAGAPPITGCASAKDCDDTIDCTIDACDPQGNCTHTTDDTVCMPLAGNCGTCTAGIGCVETPGTVKELLLDPNFDEKTGDWTEFKDGLPTSIVADATAQTPGTAVHFGPAPVNATVQGFIDLSQQITIPANAIALSVSGYYKLTPGKVGGLTRDASDDYATLTLFSLDDGTGNFTRFVDYHEWDGTDPKQIVWTAFTYTTSKAVLNKVRDIDVTLDLVTETWDTRFLFDSLSLKATVCE